MTERGLVILFNRINQECFNGRLEPIPIKFKKCFGYSNSQAKKYNKGGVECEATFSWDYVKGGREVISINSRWKKAKTAKAPLYEIEGGDGPTIMELMIHEMLHYDWKNRRGEEKMYHTPYFHSWVYRQCRRMGIKNPAPLRVSYI